MSEKHRM